MLMKCLYAIVVSFLLCASTFAQGLETTPELENFKYHVKQIEEFMERFNGETSLFDKDKPDWQQKNLMLLFERDVYVKRKTDADHFIAQAISRRARLHFNDSTWLAEAECNAEYAGKPTRVTLLLSLESAGEGMLKWVLCGAEGKVLALSPQKSVAGLKISPVDHELNFISLSAATTRDAVNIACYKGRSIQVDKLSVFLALVHERRLKIHSVQNLRFHFNTHGLSFIVSSYDKKGINSGWLISNFQVNEDE